MGLGIGYSWISKGLALVNLGQYQNGIECLDRILGIVQNDSKAWRLKGVSLAKLGQYQEAGKCFEKVVAIEPDSLYS